MGFTKAPAQQYQLEAACCVSCMVLLIAAAFPMLMNEYRKVSSLLLTWTGVYGSIL